MNVCKSKIDLDSQEDNYSNTCIFFSVCKAVVLFPVFSNCMSFSDWGRRGDNFHYVSLFMLW